MYVAPHRSRRQARRIQRTEELLPRLDPSEGHSNDVPGLYDALHHAISRIVALPRVVHTGAGVADAGVVTDIGAENTTMSPFVARRPKWMCDWMMSPFRSCQDSWYSNGLSNTVDPGRKLAAPGSSGWATT